MFNSLYFDMVVTSTALRFQALKEKEEEMVENVPSRPALEIILKQLWILQSRRS
jgi:hypothetical protein